MRDKFVTYIHQLQDEICHALQVEDGKASFVEDIWERPEGGGGKTRIIQNGAIFEKGGVNTSVVYGKLPDTLKKQFMVEESNFFACGISLVLHPENPMVPTVHANFRYFELYDSNGKIVDSWFGGGTDLTPYYLFEKDVIHFHQTLKQACDQFDLKLYPGFKNHCDEYFLNVHRNEARGIGGIFFDYCRGTEMMSSEQWFELISVLGNVFLSAYLPIVQLRKEIDYTDENKYWQEIRRGRYVEFNLIHDRGTLFGLKTNGRIESILMSLPPRVRWDYNYQIKPNSEEDKLIQVLQKPVNWVFPIIHHPFNI